MLTEAGRQMDYMIDSLESYLGGEGRTEGYGSRLQGEADQTLKEHPPTEDLTEANLRAYLQKLYRKAFFEEPPA